MRRYILVSFARLFTLALLGFGSVYLIVEFFERIDDFLEHSAAPISALNYFLFKIPLILYQVTPAAVLLASVLCFVILSRNNELTVLKASGFSILSLSNPIIWVALFLSLVSLGLQEYVVPYTNRKVVQIYNVQIKKEVPKSLFRNRLWYRSGDGSLWKVSAIGPEGRTLLGVSIFRLADDRLTERIDAREIEWNGRNWVLHDGVIRDFRSPGQVILSQFKGRPISVAETPLDFQVLRRDPKQMSYQELSTYVQTLKRSGLDPTSYIVDKEVKLSFPFAIMVMAVLGIPCSLRSPRAGSVTGGIALTLLIAAGFWVLLSMGISLGHGGRLPPILAAWGANGVSLSLGLWLLMTVRQ